MYATTYPVQSQSFNTSIVSWFSSELPTDHKCLTNKKTPPSQTMTSIIHVKYMYSVFVNVTQTQMFADPTNIKILPVFEAATELMFRIRQTSYVWIYKIIWGEARHQLCSSVRLQPLCLSLSQDSFFNWKLQQPLCSGVMPLALCRLISHPQVHLGIFLFTLPCLKNK